MSLERGSTVFPFKLKIEKERNEKNLVFFVVVYIHCCIFLYHPSCTHNDGNGNGMGPYLSHTVGILLIHVHAA